MTILVPDDGGGWPATPVIHNYGLFFPCRSFFLGPSLSLFLGYLAFGLFLGDLLFTSFLLGYLSLGLFLGGLLFTSFLGRFFLGSPFLLGYLLFRCPPLGDFFPGYLLLGNLFTFLSCRNLLFYRSFLSRFLFSHG